jgi:hypothetical protein
MVRTLCCSGLALALAAQPCVALASTAAALSSSAAVAVSGNASALTVTTVPQALSSNAKIMLALPERPAPIPYVANQPGEDLVAITLISLPFTALWSLLGAAIVGGISQHQFPPNFDTPMLEGAAAVALGSSLAISLVSVQWGGSHPKPAATPAPSVLPIVTPTGPQL